MKRILLMLFVVILCVASMTGCAKKPLKIGVMVDLTGRASGLGISARNGAELAVKQINDNGGIKGCNLELIIKDDKGLPEETLKIDQELLEDNIILGIGHMTSGTGMTGIELFREHNVLMVSPLMSTDTLTGIDDIFIRIIGSNRKQGELLAEAALETNQKNTMAIVYENNNKEYSKQVSKFFRVKYEDGGGRIVYEDNFVSSQEVDFDSIAADIVKSGAGGVLIISGGIDLGVISQKLKKLEPDIRIYSGMWGMTEDAIEKGGNAVEGAYFAGTYDKENQEEEFLAFRSAYYTAYKEEPTFASVYSYETVYMVAEALKTAESTDTEVLKEQIIAISKYDGLQEDFAIDEYGDTDRGYYLFQIENAEYKRVK